MPNQTLEGVRVSPQQKHLWLLQREQDNLPYRVQCAVLIEGNLNKAILATALKQIVKKHEIFRTTFNCLTGMEIPVQVIHDTKLLWSDEHNLSDCDIQQQQAKIEELFQEIKKINFDLKQGSLCYVSLITLSPEKHILLVSLPAIIADSLTLRNLVDKINTYYAACLHGEEISDDPMQYADIAEWQNEILEGEDTKIGREYWLKQDLSAVFNLHLPFENHPQDKSDFQPKFFTQTINSDLLASLEVVARKYDTSLTVLLLACWQILLWRLTGESEIIIGTACNNRNYEELETALGLFAKYLPLHCQVSENSSFDEFVKHVHENLYNIYEWQETFTWEQIKLKKEESILPFFPFCFDFEPQASKYSIEDICFTIYKQYACIDKFKIKLSCWCQDDCLNAEFHYDSNLFNVEDIKRLAAQFHRLLSSAVNKPEATIKNLEYISGVELQQLLIEFNNTQTDYPRYQLIHQLFEEQVKQTPNNIAVVFDNEKLSYSELNARANKVAYYLKQQKVRPEVLVGLYVERSLFMIVGILGILKAGGAYIPLDPAYPKERSQFILDDSQISVLLTQQKLVNDLPENKLKIICLDVELSVTESLENLDVKMTSENLAYIIYTSGSTGKPKGVQITHQNLVHSTNARLNYYQEPLSSFLLLSSFAFDSSVAGIFWTLCSGGSLFLTPERGEQDIPKLLDLIAQNRISHLLSLPSLYELILQQAKSQQLVSLRSVIVAGEVCPKELILHHSKLLSKTSLFNEYGPTEGTVWSSVYNCTSSELTTQVSIGRPIANTQIYLLDSHLHPVSLGTPGELYISGEGLARGYVNFPDLTAEKFIPNPFSSNKEGARLYKTGDLARYKQDGNIEFIGRIDHQVKIRGFRIELGEIEAVLAQHPEIQTSTVIAREDNPGHKRLVAYIVSRQEKSFATFVDLRHFIQDKLPEFMVPSAFVQLKTLPRLPNGKIDIKALPAPEIRNELSGFVAPKTAVEKILAQIWSQILGVEQVGIHDNFFELGGDSILSIQIVAKANEAGLQLTPKQLFDNQTIAQLAAVAGRKTQTIQAEQNSITGEVSLTPIQHWFFAQNQPEPHHWNQSLLLEMQQIDGNLLEQVVQHLIEHHDALRLRFIPKESGWQQIHASPNETIVFTQVDLSGLPEMKQKFAIEAAAAELQTSLDLSNGPLVTIALFDLVPQKTSRLLIIIHHLVIDGVSWRILLEDLQTAYQQISLGEAISLPNKTTSFQQWAKCLQEYVPSAETQQDYWLAEMRKSLWKLPVDYSRTDNTVARADTISVSLSKQETKALLQSVNKAYKTQINDVLLTALVQTFAKWTGKQTLWLDIEGHGREEIFKDINLSRTVGWFTTHFPVLLDITEADDEGNALIAVKEQLRSIPNNGIGYGVLRYLSSNQEIKAKLQDIPQAEVSFNYLGQVDQVVSQSSVFDLAQESSGLNQSPHASRFYLLEVVGIVVKEQLQVNWTYSKAIHRRDTIETLAVNFIEAVRSLIVHCQSPKTGSYTPSDFPKANLSQQQLNKLLTKINQATESKDK